MAIRKLNLSGHANSHLADMGFEDFALHVDLADPELPSKVQNFLIEEVGLTSEDTVTMAAPGLAPLALIVVASIHGITGTFPRVIPMIRGEEGFVPGTPLDLQDIRNNAIRPNRDGMTVL
jgi:hypothetical protein